MYGRGRGRGRKAQQQQPILVPVLVEDVWVQCDNPDCKKWRKLPPGSKPPPDDVEWFCSMNTDPLKNSCSAPEEDYDDKDWEAREAQVKALAASLKEQGQLPVDNLAGMPVLQAPVMMYQSGLAGFGKRGLGGGEGRPRKRGKPDSLPAKYFPSHQDEMAALEVAFQHIMDNGGQYDDAVATKEAATAAASTSAAAAAAAAAADQQAQSSAAAPPHTKLALPLWLWNGFQAYAPDAAEVACQAVDLVTASLSVCGPCLDQQKSQQQEHQHQQQQQNDGGPLLQQQQEQQQQAHHAEHEALYQQRVKFAQLAVLAAAAGAMYQLQLVKRRHPGGVPVPPQVQPSSQPGSSAGGAAGSGSAGGSSGGRGRGRSRGRGRGRPGRPPLSGRGGGSGAAPSTPGAQQHAQANGYSPAARPGLQPPVPGSGLKASPW